MFVLTFLIYFTGSGPAPSIAMQEFKTRESCEAAGRAIEKHIDDETSDFAIVWTCQPK